MKLPGGGGGRIERGRRGRRPVRDVRHLLRAAALHRRVRRARRTATDSTPRPPPPSTPMPAAPLRPAPASTSGAAPTPRRAARCPHPPSPARCCSATDGDGAAAATAGREGPAAGALGTAPRTAPPAPAWPGCSAWEAAHERPDPARRTGWAVLLAAALRLRPRHLVVRAGPRRPHPLLREGTRRGPGAGQAAPRHAEQPGRQGRHQRDHRSAGVASTPPPDRSTTSWKRSSAADARTLTTAGDTARGKVTSAALTALDDRTGTAELIATVDVRVTPRTGTRGHPAQALHGDARPHRGRLEGQGT